MLNWMRKVDADMSKMDLLDIIDNMHEVINSLLEKNKENEVYIKSLKETVNQK